MMNHEPLDQVSRFELVALVFIKQSTCLPLGAKVKKPQIEAFNLPISYDR